MATFDRSYGSTSYKSAADARLARKFNLDWSGIFGGTALGWGVLLLLSVIGAAIGFAAIDPYSVHPGNGLDTASGAWGLVAMVLSSFLGAYFVVRIAGDRRRSEALLHGAISWGLSMIAGAVIALFAAGAAATAASNAATPVNHSKTYVTRNGEVAPNMTRGERIRADEAGAAAAKGAGLAGGAGALALIASLFGALFAASRSSGISIANEFRLGRGKGKHEGHMQEPHPSILTPSSSAGFDETARRDETTILPPTR